MFAARKEFELLKLLASNKKALATARRLCAFHPHPHPPSPTAAAGAGKAAAAPQSTTAAAAAVKAAPNSRQRRGALRSAKHHATRRAQFWSRSLLATMFIVISQAPPNCRRHACLPSGPADAGAPSGSVKRGPVERPRSGCSSSSSASSAPTRSDSGMGMTPDDFFTLYASLPQGKGKPKKQKGWPAVRLPAHKQATS